MKQCKWDTSLKFPHISLGKHPIFWGFLTSKQDLLLTGSQLQIIFPVLCSPCSFQAVLISSLTPEDQRALSPGSWASRELRALCRAHEGPQAHGKLLINTQQHLTPDCFVWEFPLKHPESVITSAIDGISWSPSGYLIDSRLVLRKMQLVGAGAAQWALIPTGVDIWVVLIHAQSSAPETGVQRIQHPGCAGRAEFPSCLQRCFLPLLSCPKPPQESLTPRCLERSVCTRHERRAVSSWTGQQTPLPRLGKSPASLWFSEV